MKEEHLPSKRLGKGDSLSLSLSLSLARQKKKKATGGKMSPIYKSFFTIWPSVSISLPLFSFFSLSLSLSLSARCKHTLYLQKDL
jgi:hypothetical protein